MTLAQTCTTLTALIFIVGCGGATTSGTGSAGTGMAETSSSGASASAANVNPAHAPAGAAASSAPATLTSEGARIGAASAPVTLSGTAGGPHPSSVLGATCSGYTSALPSHILEVTEDLANVTFLGSSTSDTVLFVRTPTGELLCDDDSGGYPNPRLTHAAPAGRYQIWYGTFSPGEGVPYTLAITVVPAVTVAVWAGVPSYCGMGTAAYGPITIGTSVVLGAHRGWTGSDGHGGTVTDDTWWADTMYSFVGQRTTVTELAGLDPCGCPYVRVAIDGATWGWRIRDLSP